MGVSASEAALHSFSLAPGREVVLRDCAQFRHDQTILNVRLFTSLPDAEVAELDGFGGWRSPHDHPRQVIWNHRKRGDLRYLPRVPYTFPTVVYGTPVGIVLRVREWLRAHRWLFRASTYAGGRRRLSVALRRRGLSRGRPPSAPR